MLGSWLFSLLFFAVGIVVLASGIFTLLSNFKARANRVFFELTAAIAIWSAGLALSAISPDAATCEIFRRFAAIGWSTTFAILLHLLLIITGKAPPYKKWLFYLCLFLPAFFNLFIFAVPNGLNPVPYQLHQTEYGWINVAENDVWDWIYYVYYIGYTLAGLWLLYRWGKESSDSTIKKKSRIMCLSIISALIIGTITDVILSSLYSELPQMAPVIMIIPALSGYHILQKENFGITGGVDRKTSYMNIFSCALVYIILTAQLAAMSYDRSGTHLFGVEESTLKGIIVQIQMFLSIYLVLKQNRPGYIISVIMNAGGLLGAAIYLIKNASADSLPGIIAYAGVLALITLIKDYKEKNAAYIKKINAQIIKEKFYSSVFNQVPIGIAVLNGKYHTRNEDVEDIKINPAYEKILGRTKDELQSITWEEMTYPEDLEADLAYFEQFKSGKISQYSMEKRYVRPDGSLVWVNMLVSPFSASDGESDDHVCIISDITERKEIEAALKYNNEHVKLTGLYNRSVLEKILERDALTGGRRALVGINLAPMQILTLRYGNNYSQDLIKKIADALKPFCSENYQLYNTYENRFVFYVKEYQDKKELAAFCEAVSYTLDAYLYIHGISGGIGVIELDGLNMTNADDILKMLLITSEAALRNSRRGNLILFYGPEAQAVRENEISQELTEIAAGIRPDRLYLQYQPIIDIAANEICGFEALVRLHNEKYGLISPIEFIPIAEKTSMIVPLGEKITARAFEFLNKLKETGHGTIAVSINISTIQLLNEEFQETFIDLIKEMNLNPENIGIEITESVFTVEIEEVNRIINSFKAAGIKILVDDFGTGYSSFARISELDIDCIKIDKSFIDKLLVLQPEAAITGDIISMAHKLGHCVVAEGVEHEKQLDYLRNHGCERIQGYLISQPLDEEAAINFLETYKR
jgi:PAS domain S-box-containing protein